MGSVVPSGHIVHAAAPGPDDEPSGQTAQEPSSSASEPKKPGAQIEQSASVALPASKV